MPRLTGSKETPHCFLQLLPWQHRDPVPQVWMEDVCFESTQCSVAPQLHVSLQLLGMSGILRSLSIMYFYFFLCCCYYFFNRERTSKLNKALEVQIGQSVSKTRCSLLCNQSEIPNQARLSWPPLSSAQCAQRNASCMQFAVSCS